MNRAALGFFSRFFCVALLVGAASVVNALDMAGELDRAFAPRPTPAEVPAAAPLPEAPPAPSVTPPIPPATRSALGGMLPSVRVRVSASRHTILSSLASGRIEEFLVRDGERFKQGDLLARVDDSMAKLAIQRVEAAIARQTVIYAMTKELYELGTKGAAEMDVARADLLQVEAELAMARRALARTRVEAPFSGRVAEVFAKEMQFIGEGQPLLEILDDSTLELEFIVSSHWISWFTPGFRFRVTVEETNREYEAELRRIGGKVDPLSQSMKAYAALLRPDDSLMEGMSGAAHILPPAGNGP